MQTATLARTWGRVALGLALAAAVGVAALWGARVEGLRAQTLTFTVDTAIDAADVSPGDGVCDATPLAGTQCSLRAAIVESNLSPQTDAIVFNIPGPGPHVIDVATDLPEITGAGTLIDGSGEAECGERWCVQLVFTTGLVSAGLAVDAPAVTVRRLSLNGQAVAAPAEGGISLRDGADRARLEDLRITAFVGSGVLQDGGAGGSDLVIRDNVVQGNGSGIRLLRGDDNLVSGNSVSANAAGGILAEDQDDLVIADNALVGNGSFQVGLSGNLTGQVELARNLVATASDGVVVAGVAAASDIEVGGSEAAANIFRGPLAQAGGPDPGDDWYLQNSSAATVDARYNDWGFYNRFDIEDVICAFNASHGCGTGTVLFEPFIASPLPTPTPVTTGLPLPTATPSPTATATPTGTPAAPEVIILTRGCNLRAFQPFYAPGTPLQQVAGDIEDVGVRLWFQVTGTDLFDLFDPFSPERSTKVVLGPQDEAGFICVDFNAIWRRPPA